jgi:hypothetical protein
MPYTPDNPETFTPNNSETLRQIILKATVCGRYKLRSDKQKIAEAFHAAVEVSELYLAPNDISPGSIQPVVHVNDEGQRAADNLSRLTEESV